MTCTYVITLKVPNKANEEIAAQHSRKELTETGAEIPLTYLALTTTSRGARSERASSKRTNMSGKVSTNNYE